MITIEEIKNKYNSVPYIIYDEHSYQNIWDLEWSFEWVLNENYILEKIIIVKNLFGWYEQIIDQLDDIRKQIYDDFGYYVIPLDYDWCTCMNLCDNHTKNYISNRNLNKIRSVFKKYNVKFKYIICGFDDTLGLLKTNNFKCGRINNEKELFKYLNENDNLFNLFVILYINFKFFSKNKQEWKLITEAFNNLNITNYGEHKVYSIISDKIYKFKTKLIQHIVNSWKSKQLKNYAF